MRLNKFIIPAILFVTVRVVAQKDAQLIYEGNELYHTGRVAESTPKYTRALEANPGNRKANFNLGNALYRNSQLIREGKLSLPGGAKMTTDSMANLVLDQAADNFAIVANSVSDKDTLHQAWHNIGNCYLQKKAYKEAVEAYKKSLKFNPKDEQTRYNLAYALKHMPKDKSGGGGQNNPQPQQPKMSKEQAEQLLKALMNSEKKLQDKRKQKQEDPSNRTIDKDW